MIGKVTIYRWPGLILFVLSYTLYYGQKPSFLYHFSAMMKQCELLSLITANVTFLLIPHPENYIFPLAVTE